MEYLENPQWVEPHKVDGKPPFFGYTPVIPDFYWNVESPEERIKKLCMLYGALMRYCQELGEANNENADAIKELQDMFDKFMESGFDDYYAEQIEQWIRNNLPWLWRTFAQMVWFGLTSDGYFCAYVPDSWSDIIFDTGAVYGTEQYGRLILRYNTSGQGVIDNTDPYYPNTSTDSQLAELAAKVNQLQTTVYTALTANEWSE